MNDSQKPSRKEPVREVEAEIVDEGTGREKRPPPLFEPLEREWDERDARMYRMEMRENGCGCCACLPVGCVILVFFLIYGIWAFFFG